MRGGIREVHASAAVVIAEALRVIAGREVFFDDAI